MYEVPEEIASAVRDKEQQDEIQFADLSRRNIALAPIKTNADGGMHPIFVEAVKKNQIGVRRRNDASWPRRRPEQFR